MKIAIVGTRTFTDYGLLQSSVTEIIPIDSITEIVSGGAKGADALAKRYAKDNNIKYVEFPARWNLYGKMAGPKRNEEIAKYVDILIAFWDGSSIGTRNVINWGHRKNCIVHVIYYK